VHARVIGVFIADDERLIRQGLRKLLEMDREIAVVGEAADGREAVRLLTKTRVDVLLLDMRMPHRNGLEVLADLGRAGRLPPTLVLTTFDETDLLLSAVRNGARGFLRKDVALQELLAAIRVLARGDTWFQPALTASLRRSFQDVRTNFESAEPLEPLTDRERQVLRLMAGGYSNKEIAGVLETAEGTVKNQVSSILGKIGVRDRTRAVLKAIEAGLI
jgi:DNA-binding NarL/FixJ family response regulator